jgi:transposase InsO family protein
MITHLAAEHPLQSLCRALQVSRSGYYKWRQRQPSARARSNHCLIAQIQQSFQNSGRTYGSPRITRKLQQQQISCSKNRVARLMKFWGLRAKPKRPFHPRTTNSKHHEYCAPNRLAGMSAPTRPNQVWVADITYIRVAAGWAYLAAVMDLCSRRIVGWALSPSIDTFLVKEALQRALVSRRPPAGLLHHSDRGVQYASSAFQALLATSKIIPSMSARGHCYDNATMEAFWSTLKSELVHSCHFQNLAQAHEALFHYIEHFYNRQRLHSALGFTSPVDFEQQQS